MSCRLISVLLNSVMMNPSVQRKMILIRLLYSVDLDCSCKACSFIEAARTPSSKCSACSSCDSEEIINSLIFAANINRIYWFNCFD